MQYRSIITNKFLVLIAILLSCFSIISFILTPATGDIYVFFAGANQVQFSHAKGILGAVEAWELKGCLLRIITYLFYSTASTIAEFGTEFFIRCAKFIYVISLLTVFFLSSFLLCRWEGDGKIRNTILLSSFFLVSFLLVPYSMHMQAEMTGLAILILSTSFACSSSRILVIFGGILCGAVFFIKSIIILLAISVCSVLTLVDKKENIFYFLFGIFCAISCGMIVLWLFFQQEIYDMIYASLYQRTLFSGYKEINFTYLFSKLRLFLSHFMAMLWLLPSVVIGLVSVLVSIKFIHNSLIKLCALVALWGMPSIVIIVSNNYFDYHYFLFVYSGCMSILILMHLNIFTFKQTFSQCCFLFFLITIPIVIGWQNYYLLSSGIYASSCLILVLFFIFLRFDFIKTALPFCILTVCMFSINNNIIYTSFMSKIPKKINDFLDNASDINGRLSHTLSGETVLFLDGGISPYYINAKSFLRYYFPLPLQRSGYNKDLYRTEIYKELKEKIMTYDGAYIIVAEDWFFNEGTYFFKEKLRYEYCKTDKYILFPYITWNYYTGENEIVMLRTSIYKRK